VVTKDPTTIVGRFNACINRRDLHQLGRTLRTDIALPARRCRVTAGRERHA